MWHFRNSQPKNSVRFLSLAEIGCGDSLLAMITSSSGGSRCGRPPIITRCSTSSRRTSNTFRLVLTLASEDAEPLVSGPHETGAAGRSAEVGLEGPDYQRAESDDEQDCRDGKHEFVEIGHGMRSYALRVNSALTTIRATNKASLRRLFQAGQPQSRMGQASRL